MNALSEIGNSSGISSNKTVHSSDVVVPQKCLFRPQLHRAVQLPFLSYNSAEKAKAISVCSFYCWVVHAVCSECHTHQK